MTEKIVTKDTDLRVDPEQSSSIDKVSTLRSTLMQELKLALMLNGIYKRHIPAHLKPKDIGFAELLLALSRSKAVGSEFTEFVMSTSAIYDQLEAPLSDRAQDLSLSALEEDAEAPLVASHLKKLAKSHGLDQNGIVAVERGDEDVIKLDGKRVSSYGNFILGLCGDIAVDVGKRSVEDSETVIDQHKIAYHYFEVIKVLEKYQHAGDIPKHTGLAINNHLRQLLTFTLMAKTDYNLLIENSPLSEAGKILLKERFIGAVQELNGLNLFNSTDIPSSTGDYYDDSKGKDTLHKMEIDGIQEVVGIDWKSSLAEIEEAARKSVLTPLAFAITIGPIKYQLDLVRVGDNKSDIRFVACLGKIINGKRIVIETLQSIRLSNEERYSLKEQLNAAITNASRNLE